MALSPADIALRNQTFVEGLKAGEAKKVEAFLQNMDRVVRDSLSGDELSEYSRARLNALLIDVDEKLQVVHASFTNGVLESAQAIALSQANFEVSALDKIVVQLRPVVPTAKQILAALDSTPLSLTDLKGGSLIEPFVQDWSKQSKDSIVGAIRKGVFQGQTNGQIVRAIRGTAKAGYRDGLFGLVERNARGLVGIVVQHASIVGRMETARANADIVQSIVWVSTLDSHVCVICRSLDGQKYAIDEGPRPPVHFGDRCTILLATKNWVKLSEDITRPAVVNGSVQHIPASLNYYEWLKTQPSNFQDEVLGPVRGKLFREGGLSAERFSELQLDRQFIPLTLEEMETLAPIAFHNAGL